MLYLYIYLKYDEHNKKVTKCLKIIKIKENFLDTFWVLDIIRLFS